jgi:hypothetical protein
MLELRFRCCVHACWLYDLRQIIKIKIKASDALILGVHLSLKTTNHVCLPLSLSTLCSYHALDEQNR